MALKLFYPVMAFLFVILLFLAFWIVINQNKLMNKNYTTPINTKEPGEIKLPSEDFCGVSTYGECENDYQCVESGCSSEICQSVFEETMFSSCVYKECFDRAKYNVSCKCVAKKCQWISSGK